MSSSSWTSYKSSQHLTGDCEDREETEKRGQKVLCPRPIGEDFLREVVCGSAFLPNRSSTKLQQSGYSIFLTDLHERSKDIAREVTIINGKGDRGDTTYLLGRLGTSASSWPNIIKSNMIDAHETTGRQLLQTTIFSILCVKFPDEFGQNKGRLKAIFDEILYFDDLCESGVERALDKHFFERPPKNVRLMTQEMFVLLECVNPRRRGLFDMNNENRRLETFKFVVTASLNIFPRLLDPLHMKIGGMLEDPLVSSEYSAPKSRKTDASSCEYSLRMEIISTMRTAAARAEGNNSPFANLQTMVSYHTVTSDKIPLSEAASTLVRLLPVQFPLIAECDHIRPAEPWAVVVEALRSVRQASVDQLLAKVEKDVADRFEFIVAAVKSRFPNLWYFDILVAPTLARIIVPILEEYYLNAFVKPSQYEEKKEWDKDLASLCISPEVRTRVRGYRNTVAEALQFGFFFTVFHHHVFHHNDFVVVDAFDKEKEYTVYETVEDFMSATMVELPADENTTVAELPAVQTCIGMSSLYGFCSMLPFFMGHRRKVSAFKDQCLNVCMRLEGRVFCRGGGSCPERRIREDVFHLMTGIDKNGKRGRAVPGQNTPTMDATAIQPSEQSVRQESPAKRTSEDRTVSGPMKSPRLDEQSSPTRYDFCSIHADENQINYASNASGQSNNASQAITSPIPVKKGKSSKQSQSVTPSSSSNKLLPAGPTTPNNPEPNSSSSSAFSPTRKPSSGLKVFETCASAPNTNQSIADMYNSFMNPNRADLPVFSSTSQAQAALPVDIEEDGSTEAPVVSSPDEFIDNGREGLVQQQLPATDVNGCLHTAMDVDENNVEVNFLSMFTDVLYALHD